MTNPLSFVFYGKLVDVMNMEEMESSMLKSVLFWFSFMLFLSSLFIYLERLCLSYFAGIAYPLLPNGQSM